ncbi:MAG: hypothetical protein IJY28_01070 [Clostridia bacterium]|nr:hypothetical protein [Clostridia bacterium]
MIQRPDIVCARDAAHAQAMLKNHETGAHVILLCVRPEQAEATEQARFAEEIYRTAQSCGAELALLFSDVPSLAAAQLIHHRRAKQVWVGKSSAGTSPFTETIRRLVPQVSVVEHPRMPETVSVGQ